LVIGAVYEAVSPTLQPIAFPKMDMPWLAQGNRIIDYYSRMYLAPEIDPPIFGVFLVK
jgi:hypothetical protein